MSSRPNSDRSVTDECSRKEFLPFHVPDIGDEEVNAVTETLRSGWLTTGPRAKQFEEDFSKAIGARHAVAVNSGTAALHLALEAVGVTAGDEVILPTLTFGATAEVVCYLKATPVFVDCNRETLNIDVNQLETAITSRTKAIIPVHIGGHPCEMGRILEMRQERPIRVIEDAAHALPARHLGKMVGSIGDITCFSFYATKTLTTGEGGMATTDDDQWAERMRIMSQHGINKDAWNRYAAHGSWYYEITSPGYKYNLSDIAAAMGIQQLKKSIRLWETRTRIARLYNDGFTDVPEVQVPAQSPDIQHSWHLYVIQLELERLCIPRDRVIDLLREHNIGTSVHFIPLHLHPFYRDAFGYRPESFPNAAAVYERIISLPIYPQMSESDVCDVIQAVRSIVERHRR